MRVSSRVMTDQIFPPTWPSQGPIINVSTDLLNWWARSDVAAASRVAAGTWPESISTGNCLYRTLNRDTNQSHHSGITFWADCWPPVPLLFLEIIQTDNNLGSSPGHFRQWSSCGWDCCGLVIYNRDADPQGLDWDWEPCQILSFFQLKNNFLIVFEGEVFLWCYS